MEPHNTTEKILAAIETKKVKPRPKWYFALRNSTLWLPGIITTLLGAYTVAGLLYGVIHEHLTDPMYKDFSNPLFIAAAVPLLWVMSFLLFSTVSTSLLRKTHCGYRHTTLQILLVSVASSIILGILFYAITQDTIDNQVRTYYRYPTQHQREYIIKVFPKMKNN
jgi:hypothetical protein